MWMGLLLPEKRPCEHSEWGAFSLALVNLGRVACAGPISEHTVLHFHKHFNLDWKPPYCGNDVRGGTSGQTKGLVFGWGWGLLSPVPPFPFLHTEKQERLIVVWGGRAMECLVDVLLNTAPSGTWMCPEEEDECRLERQILEKDYLVKKKKKRFIHLSQFIYHLIQVRTDPVMPADSKVWLDSSR